MSPERNRDAIFLRFQQIDIYTIVLEFELCTFRLPMPFKIQLAHMKPFGRDWLGESPKIDNSVPI